MATAWLQRDPAGRAKSPQVGSRGSAPPDGGWAALAFFAPCQAKARLINTGASTAAELEGLGEAVRADVLARLGVELEWEIKRIGRLAIEPKSA